MLGAYQRNETVSLRITDGNVDTSLALKVGPTTPTVMLHLRTSAMLTRAAGVVVVVVVVAMVGQELVPVNEETVKMLCASEIGT